MTNTFDTASFIQKSMSDLGGLSAGKPGAINLVPSMPGMGIVSSIQGECDSLEKQAPIKTRLLQLDDLQPGITGFGAAPGIDLDGVQVIVIDAGASRMTQEQTKDLADFATTARANASIWVVGGDTNALEKQLDGDVSRFGNTFRAWRENRDGPTADITPGTPKRG